MTSFGKVESSFSIQPPGGGTSHANQQTFRGYQVQGTFQATP